MKQRDLIRHLRKNGSVFVREGANHSIYFNQVTGCISSVPRHSEIANPLARKICKDLGIPPPKSKQ